MGRCTALLRDNRPIGEYGAIRHCYNYHYPAACHYAAAGQQDCGAGQPCDGFLEGQGIGSAIPVVLQ